MAGSSGHIGKASICRFSRPSALWQRFLACLYPLRTAYERVEAVKVAESTFLCFEQWLDRCGVLR